MIGTLVGSVDKQCVEVTNCFCIPHKEHEEKVEADIVYAQVNTKWAMIVQTSFSDPSHFDVDPDLGPGIHIWEKWIRIRILGSTFT